MKGNRQGSLSRSITPPQRAKLQNNLTCFYFAILKVSLSKSLSRLFDKLTGAARHPSFYLFAVVLLPALVLILILIVLLILLTVLIVLIVVILIAVFHDKPPC